MGLDIAVGGGVYINGTHSLILLSIALRNFRTKKGLFGLQILVTVHRERKSGQELLEPLQAGAEAEASCSLACSS